jgi:hypothetical protein
MMMASSSPSSSSSLAVGSGSGAKAATVVKAKAAAAHAANETGLNAIFKSICSASLEKNLEGPAALRFAAKCLREESMK